jgi:hypothetical protein
MSNGAVNVSVPVTDTTAQTSSAAMSGYGVTHGSRTMNFYAPSTTMQAPGWLLALGAAAVAWWMAKGKR